MATVFGIAGVACLWLIASIISWGVQSIWGFIDDSKPRDNFVLNLIEKEGFVTRFLPSLFIPCFLYLVWYYTLVPVIIIGAILGMFGARFTRRLSKKFELHAKHEVSDEV